MLSLRMAEVKEIPLKNGGVALIDAADWDLVAGRTWRRHSMGYASWPTCRDGKRVTFLLHRMVLGVTDPSIRVDHVNGDKLDNRRANLRVCTHSQNLMNRGPTKASSSGFKGVHWSSQSNKWVAEIKASGRKHYLGTFDDPKQGARAYDAAALRLHGEFARPNFPAEQEAPCLL